MVGIFRKSISLMSYPFVVRVMKKKKHLRKSLMFKRTSQRRVVGWVLANNFPSNIFNKNALVRKISHKIAIWGATGMCG